MLGYDDSSPVLVQFRAAMERRGLELPKKIEADGKIHRCNVKSKNRRGGRGDGAYLLHLDGAIPAGGFENWQDGHGWENWSFNHGRKFSHAELNEIRRKSEAGAKARQDEKARNHEKISKKAARLWEYAKPCPDAHPYLIKKSIKAHGARTLY